MAPSPFPTGFFRRLRPIPENGYPYAPTPETLPHGRAFLA
jgi:hypothetical protein